MHPLGGVMSAKYLFLSFLVGSLFKITSISFFPRGKWFWFSVGGWVVWPPPPPARAHGQAHARHTPRVRPQRGGGAPLPFPGRPATVPLTPSAGFNGIRNRQ